MSISHPLRHDFCGLKPTIEAWPILEKKWTTSPTPRPNYHIKNKFTSLLDRIKNNSACGLCFLLNMAG